MITDHEQKKNDRTNPCETDFSKTDLFMDAIGSIDPQYIEEAHQAVSSGFSEKRPISCRIKRLIHSPAPVLAAAACLTLLVLAGASRTGILQDLFISSSKNSSLSCKEAAPDSMADAAETQIPTSPPSLYLSVGDSIPVSEVQKTDPAEHAAETVETAEVEKADDVEKTDDVEKADDKDKENRTFSDVSALKNSYNWTWKNDGSGELTTSTTSTCDADYIWTASDLPVLTIERGSSITPDFGDVQPDSFSVRCLAASDRQAADPQQHCVDITAQEDGSFTLPEADRFYIVEITAEWDDDLYSGSCTYGFRAEYEERAE
ncbi:MAG: hypothetical protein SOW08_02865 [Lachnospiraceae bacterium]|nr:hypothetical protein [Lachnospiraceae bacterium]